MTTKNGTDQTTPRTAAEFKQWSIAHKSLAKTVLKARAVAELERARVDAYVLPIFQQFNFTDDAGEKIKSPKDLYLSEDEEMCKAFYAQCQTAHRAHGFTGPEGYCPALVAENLHATAEHTLLQAGCEFMGVETYQLDRDKRKEMLDLLLRACISA